MTGRGQVSRLIGRDAELSRLTELIRGVVAGRGRAVLVEGEPGIGKTSLVGAACTVAAQRCSIYWGAGDELGQALPLLPILDALRVLRGTDNPRGEVIGRLLRGEVPVGGADPVAAASEQLLALVGELCAAGPVVLVVDDLQWADRSTIAVWARLARSVSQHRLLLVGIMRPVPRSDELLALRRAAADCVHLSLGPLPEPAVVDLVQTIAGGKPGEDLLRLADGATGNPLFLTELVDALVRGEVLRVTASGVAELVGDGVPGSLSAAIGHRLEFLPVWVSEVLRAAALLGVEFSVSDLAIVLDRRIAQLCAALDEARAAGVLRAAGENLAFRHPLIRQVLYEDIPDAVKAAWHLDAARTLAKAGAQVPQVARQLLRALRRSHAEVLDEWLMHWLADAAPSLVAQSPLVAVELLRMAMVDAPAGEHRSGVLACRLADALYRTGNPAEAERVAARAVVWVADPGLLVDLQWTLTQCRAMTGRSAESLAALERTLATPGIDPRHRARLLVLTARTQRDLGKVDAAMQSARRALAEAEAAGDRWAIAWALHVLIIGSVMQGEVSSALPLFERALAVTDGDPALIDLRLLVQVNQAVALGDLDQYAGAIEAAGEVRELAERMGSLVRLAQAHSALGELLFDVGRWDEALAVVEAVSEDIKDPGVACCDHGVAAVVGFHRADPASARHQLELAAPCAERIGSRVVGSLALARSLECECSGAPDQALAALTESLTRQAEELEEMEDLLPDAVRLAMDLGDQRTATDLAEQAEGLANRSAVPHRLAAALYCRGLLDGDPDRLLLAADRYGAAGRPLPRAKALEAAAIVLADRGDLAQARSAFTLADDIYDSLGASWDTDRLRSVFRSYGIRRGPRVKHQHARSGWRSLTPAETRIAELVVEGMSNRQIADRLCLSPRTVGTHVSHILAKVGLRSRIDIARERASLPNGHAATVARESAVPNPRSSGRETVSILRRPT
jgi:DNA-binding CsgD family transcriptional regulator